MPPKKVYSQAEAEHIQEAFHLHLLQVWRFLEADILEGRNSEATASNSTGLAD